MKNIDLLLSKIIPSEYLDYGCFSLLKEKLQDDNFYNLINEGITSGDIRGFTPEFWQKLIKLNVYGNNFKNLNEALFKGLNIGRCKDYSMYVSYALDFCHICGGVLPLLIGTANSPDGSHTWISNGSYIIDTSLMLEISNKYVTLLGYIEQNRNKPTDDVTYYPRKEFACDTSINRGAL